MKTKQVIIILLFFSSSCYAKIWRVDNNATNKPDFTSLQAAYDASSVGDTLYISGHGNSYGYLEISKQIVVIGPGYFLDHNLEKGVNPFEAQIPQITFKIGAENSKVISCSMNQILIECNNIILKRNIIRGTSSYSWLIKSSNPCSGIIIQQCFISGRTPPPDYLVTLNGDNIELSNNLVSNDLMGFYALQISSSGLIKNNIFNGLTNIIGMVCENNIGSIGGSDNIARNNVPLGDMNTMFMLTGNEDEKYILKEGSPAIGAGVNGVDCGMFGGDEPYVLSGIPPIPTIYEVVMPTSATQQEGLKVILKAKTNR